MLQVQEQRFPHSLWWSPWQSCSTPAAQKGSHQSSLAPAVHPGLCGNSLKEAEACGESTLSTPLLQDWTLWPEPTLEQFLKHCSYWRTQDTEFCCGLYPLGGISCWRKEQQRWSIMNWSRPLFPIPYKPFTQGLYEGQQEEVRGLWACEEWKGSSKVLLVRQCFSLFHSVTITWWRNKRN